MLVLVLQGLYSKGMVLSRVATVRSGTRSHYGFYVSFSNLDKTS